MPFQYPRSDRRRCNSFCGRMLPMRTAGLSVSSVGSEAMQQQYRKDKRDKNGTFSILGRIGGDATQRDLRTFFRAYSLSVSSVGSEAMQREEQGYSRTQQANFQYPRSDRRRCNPRCPAILIGSANFQYPRSDRRRCNFGGRPWTGVIYVDLSVSSVGSEAMQPCTRWTSERCVLIFQYPRSDRRRCNDGTGELVGVRARKLSVSSVGSEAMQLC